MAIPKRGAKLFQTKNHKKDSIQKKRAKDSNSQTILLKRESKLSKYCQKDLQKDNLKEKR